MRAAGGKKLVIVDPALMTASGHHAGLATFVANTVASSDYAVEYACHRDIDPDIRTALEQAGVRVHALFTINFYQYFDQPVRIPEMQDYLQQAAREYRVAIEVGRARSATAGEAYSTAATTTLYFHPSLNWDHAFILALVLRQQPPPPGVVHKCCAMFTPGLDHRGGTIDTLQELNYRMAFKPLHHHDQVEIFTSDTELAEKYQRIVEKPGPLPVHPTYLADWQALSLPQKPAANKAVGWALPAMAGEAHPTITLYLGEAKINKGFCHLPALARQLLQHDGMNLTLYIQYTHCWEDADIETAAEELAAIAATDSRLVVDTTYLSDAALHERLQNTDIYVFTYDEKAYGEKSSGILHLVAWYGLKTVFLSNTWLNREARRLGLPMLETSQDDFTASPIDWWLNKFKTAKSKEVYAQYRQQLYTSFWNWLSEGAYSHSHGNTRHSRESGNPVQ